MTDQDTFALNGHSLRCDLLTVITLDDPAADYDPTIVEDRAELYAVVCQTCRHVTTLTVEERMRDVTHLCRNKRTGAWLETTRPRIDDTEQDALARIITHCQPSIVSLRDARAKPGPPFGYGDATPIDEAALAAIRMLSALGQSPWKAAKAYAARVSTTN